MKKTILYDQQTKLAVENYPISGIKSHPQFIYAIVLIKKAAAIVNAKLHLLTQKKSQSIINACDAILSGSYSDQIVVDVYQAGAGTSVHMNINEVIAYLAHVHPNDEVNMSQSTNDVIPTSVRIAALQMLPELLNRVDDLTANFHNKSKEFEAIVKAGRTHLQDALPLTLGQEFCAYEKAIENDRKRIKRSSQSLLSIGIGGTAVGTGINTHPHYHLQMINKLRQLTKFPLRSSNNLFESMQFTADFLDMSACLRTLATTLIKIGNDLRLLSSGPKSGFAEIKLPEVQAGSSIMPGKINPSIIEMLTMVCFQIIGFDQSILLAATAGQLELNVMFPLIAYNLLEQIKLLTNAVHIFNKKCVKGITADEKMCRFWLERSTGIAAVLNPYLGYDKTGKIVKLAEKSGKSTKEFAIEKGYLTKQQIKKIFAYSNLIKPNLII